MKKLFLKAISVSLAACMLLTFASCSKNENDETTKAPDETTTQPMKIVNPLTNDADFNEAAVGKRPLAIVINNQPEARPQWGLNSADAVFEFPVEGMITRMMWLFADYEKLPDKIGPIRSARHHFVYTAGSLDAIYTHWGGSELGYKAIETTGIDDIDALKGNWEEYFYRDKTRDTAIEHRGITDGDKLREALTKIERTDLKKNAVGGPFVFSSQEVTFDKACTGINVYFSKNYVRNFTYNADKKEYMNAMNNKAFCDGNDKSQNSVKNVVVLFAPTKTLPNELVDVDLTGGSGYYLTNGTYQNIKWKKGNDGESELKLTYEDGKNVELNSGKTWFNFVPTGAYGEAKTVLK